MSTPFSRKTFLKLAGTSAASAFLAACTPAPPAAPVAAPTSAPQLTQPPEPTEAPAATEAPAPTPAPAAASVALEFVMNTSPGWDDAVNKMMGMFMKDHPDISIKFTPIDWGQLTIVLPPRFAAKDPPDLLLCDCFWPWVQQGLVADLNPLIERDKVDLSLIADVGAGLLGGNPARYGLPFDFTGSVIGYNKTMFDKYGVAYPKDGWTADDLRNAAIALTRDINDKSPADPGFDASNIKVYGTMLNNPSFWGPMVKMWGGSLWSEDGKTCTIDSPDALASFEFWNELACKQHAVYGPQPTAQAGAADPFVSQLVAMPLEGEWQLALWKDIQDFDFDVAAWPKGPKAAWQYGASDALGIAKDSKSIDASWEFQKYWTYNKDAALVTGTIMPPALNDLGLDDSMLGARVGTRGPTLENVRWAYTNMRMKADGSWYYQGIHAEEWQPVFSEMLTSILTLCNEPVDPLVPNTAKQMTEILQKA